MVKYQLVYVAPQDSLWVHLRRKDFASILLEMQMITLVKDYQVE